MGDATRGSCGAIQASRTPATADFRRNRPVSRFADLVEPLLRRPLDQSPTPRLFEQVFYRRADKLQLARLVRADLHEGADHRLAGVIRLVAEHSQDPQSTGGQGRASRRRIPAHRLRALPRSLGLCDPASSPQPSRSTRRTLEVTGLDPLPPTRYFTRRKIGRPAVSNPSLRSRRH